MSSHQTANVALVPWLTGEFQGHTIVHKAADVHVKLLLLHSFGTVLFVTLPEIVLDTVAHCSKYETSYRQATYGSHGNKHSEIGRNHS